MRPWKPDEQAEFRRLMFEAYQCLSDLLHMKREEARLYREQGADHDPGDEDRSER